MFQKELLLIQIVHIIPVLETLAIPRELKQKQHDILLKKTFDGALKQNATCIYFFIKVYISSEYQLKWKVLFFLFQE